MFKCNLTGVTYKYESMNLLALRDQLVNQYGLKPWDIYAGYSEKSVIKYTEEQIEVSDAQTPWKLQLAETIAIRKAELAARKQQDIDALEAELARLNAEILALAKQQTGVELPSYEAYKRAYRFKMNIPVSLQDEQNRIANRINKIATNMLPGNVYAFALTAEDLKIFEDDNLFIAEISHLSHNNVVTATTLLNNFDFRKMICILDYCERNNLSNDDRLIAFNVDTTKEYAECIDIFSCNDYLEKTEMSRFFDSDKYGLYRKVGHADIYNFIVAELNKYAEKLVVVDRDIYYQQVDITPITINITSEGKLELIDGYKRLLHVNNPELLDILAPIKVYTELDDKDFIRLLYSANAWKTVGSRGVGPFHDRGFIFALRQRFGIRFEDYFHNSWKDIDLLKLLQIYDAPSKYCLYNKYLIEDIKALAHLNEVAMPFFQNENNRVYHEIIRTMIQLMGELRRANMDVEQHVVDFNQLLATLLENKAWAKKIASKENMTVGGYISNFVNEHVYHVLKEGLLKAMIH